VHNTCLSGAVIAWVSPRYIVWNQLPSGTDYTGVRKIEHTSHAIGICVTFSFYCISL
jgi:hypothetical protein